MASQDSLKGGSVLSFFDPRVVHHHHHVLCLEVSSKPTLGGAEEGISAASKDGAQRSLNTL